MYAVALTGKEQLEYREVTLSSCGPEEITLKVHAVGICGSDLRIFKQGDSRIDMPRVTGHEIAGEIIETGSMVTGLEKGDRVTLGAHIPCGFCYYCQKNMGHQCEKKHSIGYQVDGGFAEYAVLPREFVRFGSIQKIAGTTSFEQASLSEPFSCVLSGIREVGAGAGDTIVVYGAGAIGCMYIAALKRMGAARVIAVQRSAPRRQKAAEAGADRVVDPSIENMSDIMNEETNGLGADRVIVTAPSAELQNEALDIVRKTGSILLFAGMKSAEAPPFDTDKIIYKQLRVTGTHGAPRDLHMEAVKWIDEGLINFDLFITHTFALYETDLAFRTADGKEGLKCVVLPQKP
ncbi:alcohol dehydrogenase catalytic domain-containing protein [Salibacterium halotolerans]|uniref:L-iditol 2-dehydrogenase n=1 Tax=Salibacterium halotolerans TaxID=1884432 RepID=A0A1I5TDN7_9BACI|nr:alcohol dehydrogenase catalytic domain-containing protein [Salibacterium halotolerans]SFP81144.1 L-iditol 2-dehydrogenase [Salibacterium halotolerans]